MLRRTRGRPDLVNSRDGVVAGLRGRDNGRMGLPDLLHVAADVLDRAGSLEPVHLALADRTVQITFGDAVTMADQRASVDRLAAATSAVPVLSGLGAASYTYTLTSDLPGDVVLLAATHPTMNRTAGRRTTSTAAHAAMLRSLAPWTGTLADTLVDVTGLQVHDHERRFSVQLTVDGADDPDAACTTACAGITALRTQPAVPYGIDARGRLPGGQPVMISVL